jgi:hypothetical protein
MDLTTECEWYPAAEGTLVRIVAAHSPEVRIHESGPPLRPSTVTWGAVITRSAMSEMGYDLPDAVIGELARDGQGSVAPNVRIPAERLDAAAERAAERG